MRKVTRDIKTAFAKGERKQSGNTTCCGQSVFLHGNKIIERRGNGVWWTLAGWPTPTTRDRINGILEVGVYQKEGIQWVNRGKVALEIDPDKWYQSDKYGYE